MTHRARARWSGGVVLAAAISAALLVAPAHSGALAGPSVSAASSLPAGFTDKLVWNGFQLPTAIAFARDGRVFVAEKSGDVKVFANLQAKTPKIWATFKDQVMDQGDRGFLGLVVDPRIGTAGHNFVYVLYTLDAPPGRTPPTWGDNCPRPPGIDDDGCVVTGRLARIEVNPDGSAGATKNLINAEWCQQFGSHSIGHLAFGPDGMLYVSGGEGAYFVDLIDIGNYGGTLAGTPTPANPCGDPPGGVGVRLSSPTARGGSLRAQSPRRPAGEPVLLSGTLLRVNPKNGAGVPGNPMFNKANKFSNASRIVAYGFRNPYRFTFRPGTPEIWVADVGWNTWEEINRVPGASVKPTPNFGWPCYEGASQNSAFTPLDLCKALYADHAAPAAGPFDAYNHSSKLGSGDSCTTAGGSSVISAISFNAPNSNYPAAYKGALFFGDHSRNCIWVERAGGNGLPSRATLTTFVDDSDNPGPVDLETDPVSGDLFYVNIYAGSIHRITYHR
jgi:glucose/arabinose dehydrogenase